MDAMGDSGCKVTDLGPLEAASGKSATRITAR
jgi:hypothetical protein